MDPYTFSLTLGSVGLGVMALSGFAHATHAGHGHGAHGQSHGSHVGHGHATGGHSSSGPAQIMHGVRGAARSGGTRAARGSSSASRLLSLLQPRVAFSVLVGFGAAGLVLRPFLPEPALLAAALGAGLVFEWGLVAPLWRFLFRFASEPAETLESVVSDEARAVTSFDANGNGLVAVELDGQVVQLLATLNASERGDGAEGASRRPASHRGGRRHTQSLHGHVSRRLSAPSASETSGHRPAQSANDAAPSENHSRETHVQAFS